MKDDWEAQDAGVSSASRIVDSRSLSKVWHGMLASETELAHPAPLRLSRRLRGCTLKMTGIMKLGQGPETILK